MKITKYLSNYKATRYKSAEHEYAQDIIVDYINGDGVICFVDKCSIHSHEKKRYIKKHTIQKASKEVKGPGGSSADVAIQSLGIDFIIEIVHTHITDITNKTKTFAPMIELWSMEIIKLVENFKYTLPPVITLENYAFRCVECYKKPNYIELGKKLELYCEKRWWPYKYDSKTYAKFSRFVEMIKAENVCPSCMCKHKSDYCDFYCKSCKNSMTRIKCKGMKRDGTPCKAKPSRGSLYCQHHGN